MIRETFGAQLPSVEESHVGDRFYNTIEDKHYVFDDGGWKAVPETPEPSLPTPTPSDAGKALVVGEDGNYTTATTGVNQIYAIDTVGTPIPYRAVIATPPSVFNNVYVHDVSSASDGDYVAAAITFHGLSGEDAMALAGNYPYISFDEQGVVAEYYDTPTALFATDPDASHWHLALKVKIMAEDGDWFDMGNAFVMNSATEHIYFPSMD